MAVTQHERMERDSQILDLRHQRYTFRSIAHELDISVKTAYEGYQRALRAYLPPAVVLEEREAMLDGMDADERTAREIVERDHPVVSQSGKIVVSENGRPVLDDGPRLAALNLIMRIRERRARLLGLDAPSKSRVEVISDDALLEAIREMKARHSPDDPDGLTPERVAARIADLETQLAD